MKDTVLFDSGHQWVIFGRDPDKPHKIIDTNQCLVRDGNRCVLLDPGGIESFSAVLAAVMRYTAIQEITDLFASHQDPDIISSLGLWDRAVPHAKLHAPWLWEGFLRHFGCDHLQFVAVRDEGGVIPLNRVELQLIPAHYLHSSGNFHVYDPTARILFSGDVGAALEDENAPMFVEHFSDHTRKMAFFHQRWMPSNAAKLNWIKRVRDLQIDLMVPQHGRVFRGDDVKRFLDWFEALNVGIAI